MIEKVDHILVNERKTAKKIAEMLVFISSGKMTVQQKVGNFNKGAVLGQILDGVATITQNTLRAVKVGYLAGTGSCIHVALVQGDVPCILAQVAYVDRLFSFSSFNNWERVAPAFNLQFCCLVGNKFINHKC